MLQQPCSPHPLSLSHTHKIKKTGTQPWHTWPAQLHWQTSGTSASSPQGTYRPDIHSQASPIMLCNNLSSQFFVFHVSSRAQIPYWYWLSIRKTEVAVSLKHIKNTSNCIKVFTPHCTGTMAQCCLMILNLLSDMCYFSKIRMLGINHHLWLSRTLWSCS